jgi:Tfp pilus assembly protein PilP
MKYFSILVLLSIAFNLSAAREAENFFKKHTDIVNPLKLRDPFRPPLKKIKQQRKSKKKNTKGYYTNLTKDDLSKLELAKLRIMGVVIGAERRALARVDGKKQLILREGMKIGATNAELKAILPGGVIFVEKIINVYNETEYLETVIPISK